MGDVQLTFRVLPESPDVDLAALAARLEAALPEGARLQGTQTKPFAFGLQALMCVCVVPDSEGVAEQLELALRELDDVQGVELIDMGRLI